MDLFPDAQVSYGPPQPNMLVDQVASVIGATVQHGRPTVGGPTRSREETADMRVILSCASAGDGESWDNAQQWATEGAYAMLDALEDHFRDRTRATLDGACRDAIISSHELDEYFTTNDTGTITGRVGEIAATITCRTRI